MHSTKNHMRESPLFIDQCLSNSTIMVRDCKIHRNKHAF